MRSSNYGWAACLLLTAGLAYGWFHARVPPSSAAREAPHAGSERAMQPREERDELDAVRQELSALRAELGTLRTVERARVEAAPAPERTVEAPTPAEQEQRFVNYMTEFDQRFRDEPRDHTWADATADEIRRVLASGAVSPGIVTDVDCRSRTCKLELADADRGVLGKTIDGLVQEFAATLPNARVAHDGDLERPKPTALYFTRESPEDSVPAVARK